MARERAAKPNWFTRRMPTREALMANRWARPFARWLGHPNLWHWNRHSVARGMALGLFVGIVIPLIQSPAAAALAIPARGNLPSAVVATFVTNPFTTPIIYVTAYKVGMMMLAVDMTNPLVDTGASMALLERVLAWLVSASLPTALGLLTFATIAAFIGYFGTHWAWRWRTSRRWHRRRRQRLERGA